MHRLDDKSWMSGDVHVRFCERLEGKFLRATRLAIFVKSKRAGERVLASVSRYLERKLKVKVNASKSKVSQVKNSSVLGFKIHGKKLKTLASKVQGFVSGLLTTTFQRNRS